MPSVNVIDLNNATVGSIDLADAVFGAEVNEALLYEAVRQHTAARRSGTAATKTRHEVSGSGKKLWKQKGTGRARMGSIRSPLWRHGGTVHGPQPRSYAYKLPRKMQLGALRSALSAKLRCRPAWGPGGAVAFPSMLDPEFSKARVQSSTDSTAPSDALDRLWQAEQSRCERTRTRRRP